MIQRLLISLLGQWIVIVVLASVAISQDTRDALLKRLPTVDSAVVNRVFTDPKTLWYTEADMPPAYQTDTMIDMDATFHDTRYDLSGGADEKRKNGNGNNEFPWFHPGGTDRSNVTSLRAISLPVVDGQMLPVVAFRETVAVPIGPNYRVNRLSWIFPKDTIVLEVLFLNDEQGTPWAFAVRVRTRLEKSWDVSVFRPVATRDDLQAEFDFQKPPVKTSRVVAAHPNAIAFDEQRSWEPLPLLAPEDVRRLLARPFQDCTAVNWSEGVAEPTSLQRFSLVPPNYDGTLAGNDPETCANCHKHVARHVSNFDIQRDWYGFIRGSDGIFSFLPVDRSSISRSGEKRPVRLRSDLVSAGYLVNNPAAVGSPHYQKLKD